MNSAFRKGLKDVLKNAIYDIMAFKSREVIMEDSQL